jgi:hypothetical protein
MCQGLRLEGVPMAGRDLGVEVGEVAEALVDQDPL